MHISCNSPERYPSLTDNFRSVILEVMSSLSQEFNLVRKVILGFATKILIWFKVFILLVEMQFYWTENGSTIDCECGALSTINKSV